MHRAEAKARYVAIACVALEQVGQSIALELWGLALRPRPQTFVSLRQAFHIRASSGALTGCSSHELALSLLLQKTAANDTH